MLSCEPAALVVLTQDACVVDTGLVDAGIQVGGNLNWDSGGHEMLLKEWKKFYASQISVKP